MRQAFPLLTTSLAPDFSVIRSKKQFTFFPFGTYFFQRQSHSREQDGIDLPGRAGTDGNAAHAGDTCLIIHLFGIVPVNCLHRARRDANTALGAILCGFGNQTCPAGFFVGPVAWQRRFSVILRREFGLNLPANPARTFSSCASGRPVANCRAMECSATAATAAITRNPACFAASSSSTNVSS